jgi:hypothetical protein
MHASLSTRFLSHPDTQGEASSIVHCTASPSILFLSLQAQAAFTTLCSCRLPFLLVEFFCVQLAHRFFCLLTCRPTFAFADARLQTLRPKISIYQNQTSIALTADSRVRYNQPSLPNSSHRPQPVAILQSVFEQGDSPLSLSVP